MITRTARVWTRLNKALVKDLNEIAQSWLKRLMGSAEKEISSGQLENVPELPEKFIKTLSKKLREAFAQGYWLNHLHVQELKVAKEGKKYHGRIKLSDMPSDEELRDILRKIINFFNPEEWHNVVPQNAINWLENYLPSLAGIFSIAVLEKTRDVIRNSLQDGSTLQERMKALRESSEEISSMAKTRIEAIARTEITRADTLGRLTSMKTNDDIIGVEFSAVLDDRTTEICQSRHGLVMRLDDPRLPENTPPLHVNCRSLLLSATIYDYPDGLLTSHEFEETPPSMQRPEDINEVEKILNEITFGNR